MKILCSACIVYLLSLPLHQKVGLIFSGLTLIVQDPHHTLLKFVHLLRLRKWNMMYFSRSSLGFFHAIPHWRLVLIWYPFFMTPQYCSFLSRLHPSDPFSLSSWVKKNCFYQQSPRNMLSFPSVLFIWLPGLWDESSPKVWVPVRREHQLLCWLSRLFECAVLHVKLQHRIILNPKTILELTWFGRTAWLFCFLSVRFLALLFPTKYGQAPEMPDKLTTIPSIG